MTGAVAVEAVLEAWAEVEVVAGDEEVIFGAHFSFNFKKNKFRTIFYKIQIFEVPAVRRVSSATRTSLRTSRSHASHVSLAHSLQGHALARRHSDCASSVKM